MGGIYHNGNLYKWGVTSRRGCSRCHESTHVSGGSDDIDSALADAAIPNLAASKITSGQFSLVRMPRGTDTHVLTAKGAGTSPAYEAAAGGVFYISTSNDLVHSNDTERVTISESYVKVKEMKLEQDLDVVRLKYSLSKGIYDGDYPTTVEAKVYTNGGAIGIERSTNNAAPQTYSEDFADWVKDDLIQIYAKRTHATKGQAEVINQQMYFLIKMTAVTNQDP